MALPGKGMALLEAADLRVGYRGPQGLVWAVENASFSLEAGTALGLVGESGSGKSSLALALMRLLPPHAAQVSGRVRLEGEECSGVRDEEFRRRFRWGKLAMVFQGAMESFNPVIKVGEQIVEPLRQRGMARPEARRRAAALLEAVRLPAEVAGRYAHELSGGMKQRALIAMALVLYPKLLILDEPTSALDVIIQAEVMNLLKRLKRELGLGMLFITHDIALASDLCDRIAVMYAGELVEIGDAEGVLLHPGHPYTQLLLAAVPRLRDEREPASIPGTPPDLANPPPACRFHPRCPYAFARCFAEWPPFLPANGHRARCWLLTR